MGTLANSLFFMNTSKKEYDYFQRYTHASSLCNVIGLDVTRHVVMQPTARYHCFRCSPCINHECNGDTADYTVQNLKNTIVYTMVHIYTGECTTIRVSRANVYIIKPLWFYRISARILSRY